MAKQKSAFRQMSDSIKAVGTAVADVAQAAIIASSDLPEGGGYRPVKKQRWAQKIEAADAKKSTAKKSKRKQLRARARRPARNPKRKSSNMRTNSVGTLTAWCLGRGCNHHSILDVSSYPD